jgi:hypothetical protein
MLAGGLVYLYPLPHSWRFPRSLEGIGLGAILFSFLLFNSQTPWPGAFAVVPVLGTALVLMADRQNSLLTANSLSQGLGLISYSLYLWHWPISVGIIYLGFGDDSPTLLCGILLSLLLAALSYLLIEKRQIWKTSLLRRSAQYKRQLLAGAILSMPILLSLVVFSAAKVIRNTDGASFRINNPVFANPRLFLTENQFSQSCHQNAMELPQCVLADATSLTERPADLILLGDSHGDVVATAIAQAVANLGGNGLLLLTKPGCILIPGFRNSSNPQDSSCSELSLRVAEILETEYAGVPLILVHRFPYHFGRDRDPADGQDFSFITRTGTGSPSPMIPDQARREFAAAYQNWICTLAKTRKVFILGPVPEFDQDVIDVYARRVMLGDGEAQAQLTMKAYRQQNKSVLALLTSSVNTCQAVLIDPLPALCDGEDCFGIMNNLPLYQDDNHLNEYGNKLLIPLLEKALKPVIINRLERPVENLGQGAAGLSMESRR